MPTYPRYGTRGVFCLEGDWDDDLRDRSSVLPTLEMLDARHQCSYIHRDVATIDELEHYVVQRAKRRYEHYSVIFLAFHGQRGKIHLGRETVTLEQLGEVMDGRCAGTLIYFGSCSTTWVSIERLEEFRRQAGAAFVAGYRRDVDWVTSAAFEFILLQALSEYSRIGDALNYLERKDPRSLTESLGFRRWPRPAA